MKKRLILSISVLITLLAVLTVSSITTYAQEQEQQKPPTEEEYEKCTTDWRSFLSASVGYDGFIEYWQDIKRSMPVIGNICHQTDIDAISMQVKKSREQIRTAFLRCDKQNAEDLKKRYYELEMELFFLRHFIDTTKGIVIERPYSVLVEEMKDYFITDKKFVEDMDVERILNTLQTRYAVAAVNYRECTSPAIDELKDKWEEFMETLESFKDIGQETPEDRARREREEKLAKDSSKAKDSSASGGVWNAIKSKFAVKIDPEKSLEKLTGKFDSENEDSIGYSKIPLGKVQGRIAEEKQRVEADKSFAEKMVKFEVLYGQASDESIRALENKMQNLVEIINTSIPKIKHANQCANQTGAKPCS